MLQLFSIALSLIMGVFFNESGKGGILMLYCSVCAAAIPENASFCIECGAERPIAHTGRTKRLRPQAVRDPDSNPLPPEDNSQALRLAEQHRSLQPVGVHRGQIVTALLFILSPLILILLVKLPLLLFSGAFSPNNLLALVLLVIVVALAARSRLR